MTNQKLQFIREKCIEANPEIKRMCEKHSDCGLTEIRPTRLADILLAIIKHKDGCEKEELKEILLKLAYFWNCFADNINDQDDRIINYLCSLFPDYKKLI